MEASGLSYDDSGAAGRGQGNALRALRREEMGTGARGAPVPEVGPYLKIKRVQCRRPESRPDEGRVNSP